MDSFVDYSYKVHGLTCRENTGTDSMEAGYGGVSAGLQETVAGVRAALRVDQH